MFPRTLTLYKGDRPLTVVFLKPEKVIDHVLIRIMTVENI